MPSNSSTPLRVGLVGLGRIARAHYEAIHALPRTEVLLSAVATRKNPLPWEFAEDVRVFSSYQDLLADPDLDAVIVCYPNAMHRDAVVAAAEAGKHILIEKPIGMNLKEVEEMVEAAQRAGVQLMSAQSRRFSDAIEEARKAMVELGPIFRIVINFLVPFEKPPTGWWAKPEEAGNLIIHLQGSHSVDTIVWLLDSGPNWVAARSAQVNPAFGGSDEADMILGFDHGVSASVHLSLNTKPFLHEMVVVGTEGSMRMTEYPTGVPFGAGYRLEVNGEVRLEGSQIPTVYAKQLAEFERAIRDDREPLASGRELLRTTKTLDAVVKAAETGNTVRL